MMEHGHDVAANPADSPGSFDVLIDEVVADIRRRIKAVERLIGPRRHSWSFDPDMLPKDDAEKLVVIKREVENMFNSVFSNHRRSRGPRNCDSRPAVSVPKSGGARRSSRPAAI